MSTPETPAAADADPPIKFGDRPNQVMPTSWAEAILRDLFINDPARFGRYLQKAVVGVDAPARGRRPAT